MKAASARLNGRSRGGARQGEEQEPDAVTRIPGPCAGAAMQPNLLGEEVATDNARRPAIDPEEH
eukprot:15478053-Alexandrium_andersonii.AAC.1